MTSGRESTDQGVSGHDLRGATAFSSLPEDALDRLAAVAVRETVAAGSAVYAEGAPGSDFLLVLSGSVEARRDTPFGPQTVAHLGPGSVVGEISMLDGRPRSSYVEGREDGEVVRFPGEAIKRLVEADRDLELALLHTFCRTLADKIRQANATMTRIMAPDADVQASGAAANGQPAPVDPETTQRLVAGREEMQRDLAALAHLVKGERFAAGERLFVEGDPGDRLYVLADGQVRISRRIPGLGEEAIAILEPGEVFGEMAWIDSRPRSADAIAHLRGCTVLGISRRDLDATLDANPESGARFLRLLCQMLCSRIRHMNDQLVAYRTLAWY